MTLPLESVPNFSAASDRATVDAIGDALAAHVSVLDLHTDVDHNRSVFTVAGAADQLIEGLIGAVRVAVERIDVREHVGAHPRIGAADVVPIVPLTESAAAEARQTARRLGERLAAELDLPIYLYGELCPDARRPEGMRPAYYRRGGLEELGSRLSAGELRPDLGPPRLHSSAGATIVGVRAPLIAFNVELDTDQLVIAKEIAADVREIGGGFVGVRALGVPLETTGTVQVSMNIEDWQASEPHRVVEAIRLLAEAKGVGVLRSELVGLMPIGAALAAAGGALSVPELAADDLLELQLLEARVLASARAAPDGAA